jgi:hypothetical protein
MAILNQKLMTVVFVALLSIGAVGLPWLWAAGEKAAPASDWSRWRGSNNDGVSTETGWLANWPKEGPKILWKASVGVGCSAVSVSSGKAYTMGNVDSKLPLSLTPQAES